MNESTAFRMRHKLTHALEQLKNPSILDTAIELDETYVQISRKGKN